jgi:hypothetical protein
MCGSTEAKIKLQSYRVRCRDNWVTEDTEISLTSVWTYRLIQHPMFANVAVSVAGRIVAIAKIAQTRQTLGQCCKVHNVA